MANIVEGSIIASAHIALTGTITASTVVASVSWGAIKGDITNQADLKALFDAKDTAITEETTRAKATESALSSLIEAETNSRIAGITQLQNSKQDNLSEIQLAAVNSGITGEKVQNYEDKVKVSMNDSGCLVFYK